MIRAATHDDASALWSILEPIIRAGESYALPRDMTREAALAWWLSPANDAFVAVVDGVHRVPADKSGKIIVGTYFMHPNQLGGGSHVANCGYATAPHATGKGIARAMCEHSLEHARARGYRAMQFNMVVSTNERAVRLWKSLGFAIVGTLPGAFAHPAKGDVDAYVMFRRL